MSVPTMRATLSPFRVDTTLRGGESAVTRLLLVGLVPAGTEALVSGGRFRGDSLTTPPPRS
jgi:hypothetical protein